MKNQLTQGIKQMYEEAGQIGHTGMRRLLLDVQAALDAKDAEIAALKAEINDLRSGNFYQQGVISDMTEEIAALRKALIEVAAWLLSPESTRSIDGLEDNSHIGHRQFGIAQAALWEVLRLKAIEVMAQTDKAMAQAAQPALPVAEMVNRFLSWPLPSTVCADKCASILDYPHRSGTNLLSAVEARQMLEHVMAVQA